MTMPIAVTLKTPVGHGNDVYSTLTFRPARAKDAMAAERYETNLEKTIAMLASMSGVPFDVFQEIEMIDLNTIVEEVAPLLGEPSTSPVGETS